MRYFFKHKTILDEVNSTIKRKIEANVIFSYYKMNEKTLKNVFLHYSLIYHYNQILKNKSNMYSAIIKTMSENDNSHPFSWLF